MVSCRGFAIPTIQHSARRSTRYKRVERLVAVSLGSPRRKLRLVGSKSHAGAVKMLKSDRRTLVGLGPSGGNRLDAGGVKRVRFARDRHATAKKDGKLLQISALIQEPQGR